MSEIVTTTFFLYPPFQLTGPFSCIYTPAEHPSVDFSEIRRGPVSRNRDKGNVVVGEMCRLADGGKDRRVFCGCLYKRKDPLTGIILAA